MTQKSDNNLRRAVTVFFLLVLSSSACSQQHPIKTNNTDTLDRKWNQTIPGNFSGQTQATFDSARIKKFLRTYPAFNPYAQVINTFYQHRHYAYAWFEHGRLIEQASNLVNRMLNLKLEGLNKHAPYERQLDSLIFTDNTPKTQTELELMLTAQYFVFAKLAWTGRDEAFSRAADWNLPRKKIDYEQYLDTLIGTPAADLGSKGPVYRQYELLRRYLAKYHLLAAQNWPAIRLSASLRPGDSSRVVREIKVRLWQLEDFAGDTASLLYDASLKKAIIRFQERHGLSTSGLLNKEIITELNVPIQQRIGQLIVNMERSRWLPVQLEADYLAVNIPEFKLHVYHGDSLLWSCNAVVGKTMHRTTVFYGELKYIVFSPYWNVPPGILRDEVLPAVRRDPNYLATHHMEITGYKDGLPVIRQKPGSDNPLGLIKFLFPNSYNIYLHDTPSKSLFDENSRAFSHGCIRISEPAKLAAFLLKDRPDWSPEKIYDYMHAGIERFLPLRRSTPVFVVYFTAFVDRAGRLNFRKDIYGLDKHLLEGLLIPGKE